YHQPMAFTITWQAVSLASANGTLVGDVFGVAGLLVAAMALLAACAAACIAYRLVLSGAPMTRWLSVILIAAAVAGSVVGGSIPAMPALLGPTGSSLLTDAFKPAAMRWVAAALLLSITLAATAGVVERLLAFGPLDAA